MTHAKMMLNNYQTELEIGNDFNRRLRYDDTNETLQEIAKEDDERTTTFKLLLAELFRSFNSE